MFRWFSNNLLHQEYTTIDIAEQLLMERERCGCWSRKFWCACHWWYDELVNKCLRDMRAATKNGLDHRGKNWGSLFGCRFMSFFVCCCELLWPPLSSLLLGLVRETKVVELSSAARSLTSVCRIPEQRHSTFHIPRAECVLASHGHGHGQWGKQKQQQQQASTV
jgi:hypothetical protein